MISNVQKIVSYVQPQEKEIVWDREQLTQFDVTVTTMAEGVSFRRTYDDEYIFER